MITIFHKNIDDDIKKYFPDFIFTMNMFVYPCFQKKRVICLNSRPKNIDLMKTGFIVETKVPIRKKKYENFYNNLQNVSYLTNL
jgi:hypothetical protein